MSIKDSKPFGGGNPLYDYACAPCFHDGLSVDPIESPTDAGATLLIPAGAFRVHVKTTGDVSFQLPDDTVLPGKITLAGTDGYVPFDLGCCNGRNPRYPNRIVLSASANFFFDVMTPNGEER